MEATGAAPAARAVGAAAWAAPDPPTLNPEPVAAGRG